MRGGRFFFVMKIKEVSENKEAFMPLLLEGDEQEDMVRRYLWRGRLYAGYEAGALVAVCVVTEEDGTIISRDKQDDALRADVDAAMAGK